MSKLWRYTEHGPKFIVLRRGSKLAPCPYPTFVMGPRDPCTQTALAAYIAEAKRIGMEQDYIASLEALLIEFRLFNNKLGPSHPDQDSPPESTVKVDMNSLTAAMERTRSEEHIHVCPDCGHSRRCGMICPDASLGFGDPEQCPRCHENRIAGKLMAPCRRCSGSGDYDCDDSTCDGTHSCTLCNGTGLKDVTKEAIVIDYTNHRGVRRARCIYPQDMLFGKSDWHEGPSQWFLIAYDFEKKAVRHFAMKNIHNWTEGSHG